METGFRSVSFSGDTVDSGDVSGGNMLRSPLSTSEGSNAHQRDSLLINDSNNQIIAPSESFDSQMSVPELEKLVSSIVDDIGFGLFQISLFFMAGLGWASDVAEVYAAGLLIPVIKDEFGLEEKGQLGLIGSMPFVGMFVGSFLFGALSDIYGRKPVFFITSAGTFIFGICTSLSRSFVEFLCFRCAVGIFLGGNLPIDVSIFLEWTPTKWRDKGSIFLTGWSIVGTLFANLLGSFLLQHHQVENKPNELMSTNWRWFVVCLSLPSLVAMLFWRHFPESPRYLAVTGNVAKAVDVLVHVKETNERNRYIQNYISLAQRDVDRSNDVSKLDQLLAAAVDIEKSKFSLRNSFAEKFSSICDNRNGLRFVTSCLVNVWVFSALGFYMFAGWAPTIMSDEISEKYAYSVLTLTTVFQLIGLSCAACMSSSQGKFAALCLFLIANAFSMIVFWSYPTRSGMFIGYGLFNFSCSGMFGLLYLVTNLSFPTTVRTTGFGFCSGMGRISGILAPVLGGYLYDNLHLSACLVFSLSYFVSFVFAVMLLYLGRQERKSNAL